MISLALWLLYDFIFEEWRKCTFKKEEALAPWRSLTKRAGSKAGAGSVSQRYGSENPNADLDHLLSRIRNTAGGKAWSGSASSWLSRSVLKPLCGSKHTELTFMFPWIRIRTPNYKNLLLTLLKIILTLCLLGRRESVWTTQEDDTAHFEDYRYSLVSSLHWPAHNPPVFLYSLTSAPHTRVLDIKFFLPIVFVSLFFSYDLKVLGMWSHMCWRE